MSDAAPTNSPTTATPVHPELRASLRRYWRANVTLMAVLLSVWAFVGLGCGVLLADYLNQYHIAGFPLGFWFAQQGSIIVFVLLILIYALAMNRLDRKHHDELQAIRRALPESHGAPGGMHLHQPAPTQISPSEATTRS